MPTPGCVYLVGAGCGPADWITLRGHTLLQQCDAVVYDALIDPALLEAAPQARHIAAGKRGGGASTPQEDICALLIRLAQDGQTVVRLKGGDSFVFGRGGEEVLALQAAGIPFQVVPGVTSAVAIPAAAGIPVTHRALSRSVHIATAHTAEDDLPEDVDALAHMPGTLVFLMGLGRLEHIAARLLALGKPPDIPAAVISGAIPAAPVAVRGTLADIAAKTRAAGLVPPAVIVVGEVAALHLCSPGPRPLEGVRVGVTGTKALTDRLCAQLCAQGAQPFVVQTTLCRPLQPDFRFDALADGRPHWVALTSANGVAYFFAQWAQQGMDVRQLARCRFAVIGPATAKALAQHGIAADLCPAVHTGGGLAAALAQAIAPGEDVYIFRSAQGTATLPQALRDAGIAVQDIPLYTLQPGAALPALPAAPDYLVFASGTGAQFFVQRYGAPPPGTRCVCIGPVAAAALPRACGPQIRIAADASVEALVQALVDDYTHSEPCRTL